MGKHLVKCGFFSLLYKCVNIILTQIGKIALVCVCVCVCEQERHSAFPKLCFCTTEMSMGRLEQKKSHSHMICKWNLLNAPFEFPQFTLPCLKVCSHQKECVLIYTFPIEDLLFFSSYLF
jgi:hypothetical protein